MYSQEDKTFDQDHSHLWQIEKKTKNNLSLWIQSYGNYRTYNWDPVVVHQYEPMIFQVDQVELIYDHASNR